MNKIQITIKGIGAELVLGNYLPADKTIFNNWEEFFHYNDVLHTSQLIADHITEIEIIVDGNVMHKGKIPARQFVKTKSFMPNMVENSVYLRTECIENATYKIEAEIENFNINNLQFLTQDYELIFKSAKEFISTIKYNDVDLQSNWVHGEPIGNICLLCGYQNGFLIPLYDAVTKKYSKNEI